MKRHFVLIAVSLCALAAQPLHSAMTRHSTAAAKTCSDCGCKGPAGDGKCPDEKGKTCHCK